MRKASKKRETEPNEHFFPHLAWVHTEAMLPSSAMIQYDSEGKPAYFQWGGQMFALQPTETAVEDLNKTHIDAGHRRVLLNFWHGSRSCVGGSFQIRRDRRDFAAHIITGILDINNPAVAAQQPNPPDLAARARKYGIK